MNPTYIKRVVSSAPFLVFILALAVRLLYLIQSMHTDPMFYQPILDSVIHHNWAYAIAKGDWIGNESFFRAPFYPYFLGLIYAVFGVNLVIPRIIQMIIGALNCVLTLKIGDTIFNKRIGLVSGFIAAFYPLFIYFDNELLIPTVLTFLILVGFYMTLKYSQRPVGKAKWYSTGIVWGLAAITRPNILLFTVFLPFWLKTRLKEKFWPAVAFGVLGVLTVVLPVTIRNYAVSKEFVPIAWQGGVNFYIGNNPLSDGKTAIVPGTRKSWLGGFEDARRIAEESVGRKLKNSEVDRFWMTKGLEFMSEQPSKAFVLFVKKAYLFWGGYEIPNNRDLYFFARPTFLRFLFFKTSFFQFPFGVLFPLSIVGVYLAFKRKRDVTLLLLLLVTYFVSFLLFFICARYRVPITPFLIILASFAIIDTIACIKARKAFAPQLLIFVGTLIFFNANITKIKDNPALNYLTIGSIEYGKKNYPEAITYLNRSLPQYSGDVEVLTMLADCYRHTNKPEQALNNYLKALQIDSNIPSIRENIGALYFYLRRFDEAERYLREAVTMDPTSIAANVNLGHIYLTKGDIEKAIAYYTRVLEIDPGMVEALYYAGLAEYKRRNFPEAERYWRRVLAINPNDQRASQGLKALSGMR